MPATAPTLTAVNSPIWQTDGTVWALAYANVAGGRLFAGGTFTAVRPPGTALGADGTRAATNIVALKTSDGTPDTSFNHVVSGQVNALTVSPDGKTLYVGGQFLKVDNVAMAKIAAFDLTRPGYPLITSWSPAVVGTGQVGVRAIAVSPDSDTVYVGGGFSTVGGAATPNLARVSSPTAQAPGVVDAAWKPTFDANKVVNALLLAPGTDNLIVGGNFETINGTAKRALASLDTTDPAGKRLGPLDNLITTCGLGCQYHSDIKALTTDGTSVFAASEGTGGGWFDGTLAFNPSTGKQVWKDNCLGATQAIAVVGGVLYGGSHAHDCSAIRGFGQATLNGGQSGANTGPSSWHHLMGEQLSNGALLDWFPTTNAGPNNGKVAGELGPRAMVSDGTNLYVAGQFTTVNGSPQQGLTRFVAGAPRAKPLPVTTAFGSLLAGGKSVLTFLGSSDPDSSGLTYKIYRDGNYASPVATVGPVQAHFWRSPQYTVRDSGLSAGPHVYEIDAVDEAGNATRSARFTVSATGTGNYVTTAKAAGAVTAYWRLGELRGTVAADASGKGRTGTYSGALNLHVLSAVSGNSAIHLGTTNGLYGNVFGGGAAIAAPNTYAVGMWIRTNTSRGGQIVGFGNSQTGTSTKSDRLLYMTNSGQLIYGTKGTAGLSYLWTPQSYNDGTWHYVVMEMDARLGMRLYVDGVMVGNNPYVASGQSGTGWWRIGADNLTGWPQRPANAGFVGDLDEVTFYSTPINGGPQRTIMTSQ